MSADLQDNCADCKAVPVIMWNPQEASDAYAVYAILLRAAMADPSLRHNHHWQTHKAVAFDAYLRAYEPQ